MKLLEKGVDAILPLLKSRFLDAGYIVIDSNRQVIVNGQSAFSVSKALGKKNIYVIEA